MFRSIAIIALLAAGCARDPSASICEVLQNPEKFNGTDVLITGTFLQGHHGALLTDASCSDAWVAFGSEASPNPTFREAVWANYLPSGRLITASIEGKFLYVRTPDPGGRLEDYKVVKFEIGAPKPDQ